ncbi:MAG: hypothetical protein WAN12_20460 [Candidatus Acidiferrum sp.]
MKVQDIERKHPPFDIASGLAEIMLRRGEVVQVIPEPKPKPIPNGVWSVQEGQVVGDFRYPPALHFHCSSCGLSMAGNPSPDRLPMQCANHCEIKQRPTEEVCAKYLEARAAYYAKAKRNRVTPSAVKEDGARLRDEFFKRQGRI